MSSKWTKKFGQSERSSVMTPLNWFIGIVETILSVGLIGSSIVAISWLQVLLFCFMVLVVAFYAFVYVYFMIKDPDRLQTESYRLASQEIALNVGPIPPGEKLVGVSASGPLKISAVGAAHEKPNQLPNEPNL